MENLFDKSTNEELLRRINSLKETSQPLWGKMNAAQMLAHCQKPLEVAIGRLPVKRGLIGLLFGKMFKNSFLKNREMKKNLPTLPSFKMDMPRNFENEKLMLLGLVKQFGDQGPSIIANKKHPIFGPMTDEEWGILGYRHLDHHLRQFGV